MAEGTRIYSSSVRRRTIISLVHSVYVNRHNLVSLEYVVLHYQNEIFRCSYDGLFSALLTPYQRLCVIRGKSTRSCEITFSAYLTHNSCNRLCERTRRQSNPFVFLKYFACLINYSAVLKIEQKFIALRTSRSLHFFFR